MKLGHRLASSIKWVVTSIGLGAILTLIFFFEPFYRWWQFPHLEVEYLQSIIFSETAVIPMTIKVNIVPQVRFRLGQYPANQTKNISVKKGDMYLPFKTEPKVPFAVRDESVPVDIWVLGSLFDQEVRGKPVKVQVLDRWGNTSEVEIKAP